MIAIAYVSTAVHPPTRFDLECLLVDARSFNVRAGVTGALLLHEVTFFQYFEGLQDQVEEVYGRIKRSRLHRDIVELLHAPVPRRQFDGWHMGFVQAPHGTLLELANARWSAQAATVTASSVNDGVALLMDFWRRARKEI